jgi:hypothetical protein
VARNDAGPKSNRHESRETWLRVATNELRPLFEQAGYPLPADMRFAIAFPSSGRNGSRVGECWHSPASADGSFEIIIRADLAEPGDVLAVLVRELVHAALPPEDNHGKRYKAAAVKIGLEGKMRAATPGHFLQERLNALAGDLGPLPHAALNINWRAIDKPKKQGTRMLKAECPGVDGEPCGYAVRLAAKWLRDVGPPHCPKHGAMTAELPPDDDASNEAEIEPETFAAATRAVIEDAAT